MAADDFPGISAHLRCESHREFVHVTRISMEDKKNFSSNHHCECSRFILFSSLLCVRFTLPPPLVLCFFFHPHYGLRTLTQCAPLQACRQRPDGSESQNGSCREEVEFSSRFLLFSLLFVSFIILVELQIYGNSGNGRVSQGFA